MAVPLFDTSTPLAPLRDELRAAIDAGARLRALHPRPGGEAFEREFAAYCGAEHAVGVANGTDAITIALRAMGVGPGDEVVVPVVHLLRVRRGDPADRRAPVFCDIDPETLLRHAPTPCAPR